MDLQQEALRVNPSWALDFIYHKSACYLMQHIFSSYNILNLFSDNTGTLSYKLSVLRIK